MPPNPLDTHGYGVVVIEDTLVVVVVVVVLELDTEAVRVADTIPPGVVEELPTLPIELVVVAGTHVEGPFGPDVGE